MSAPTGPSSGSSRPSDRTPVRSTVRSGAPQGVRSGGGGPSAGGPPTAGPVGGPSSGQGGASPGSGPGGGPTPPPDRLASIGRVVLVFVLLAAVTVAVVLAAKSSQFGSDDAASNEIPALEVQPAPVQLGAVGQPSALPLPGLVLPPGRPGVAPQAQAQNGRLSLTQWAAGLGPQIGIPPRALQAYGIADLVLRQEQPGCHLSWVTVAGLARIESNHGRYQGSTIAANGDVTPPIVGVPLDGTSGNRTIADTDGGALDGDATLDRAVGPLQFIPSTWAKWRSDGNGDGIANPNNMDDAALATGRYLCAGGRDLATGEGWRSAVLSYNFSDDYGRRVYAAAAAYARGTAV